MKKFKYKAKLKGKKKKGEIEAESLVLAKQKMRQDGFREVVLTEVKPKPKTGLNEVPCVFDKYISQLQHKTFSNGTGLFDIYAVAEPWSSRPVGEPNVTKIGELILDSAFVSSTFGDTRLFFRHLFFGSELQELASAGQEERMVNWLRYINNTDFMKTEGAMLYQQFLR